MNLWGYDGLTLTSEWKMDDTVFPIRKVDGLLMYGFYSLIYVLKKSEYCES